MASLAYGMLEHHRKKETTKTTYRWRTGKAVNIGVSSCIGRQPQSLRSRVSNLTLPTLIMFVAVPISHSTILICWFSCLLAPMIVRSAACLSCLVHRQRFMLPTTVFSSLVLTSHPQGRKCGYQMARVVSLIWTSARTNPKRVAMNCPKPKLALLV